MYGATRYSLTRVISRHSTKARTTSSSMFLLRRGNATAAAASTKSEPVHPSTDLVRTAIQRMLEDQMSMSSSADSSSSEKITAQQQALESVQVCQANIYIYINTRHDTPNACMHAISLSHTHATIVNIRITEST
jgi:accessory colonization factor AcfC